MQRTEGASPLLVQRVNLSGTEDRGSGNLNHGFGCYAFRSCKPP